MYLSAFSRTTLLLALVTGLFACSISGNAPRYFFPAPATVLNIEKKHDADLRGSVDWQPPFPSLHLQAGYSPLKNFAVAGYFAQTQNQGVFNNFNRNTEWNSAYRYGELSIGFYKASGAIVYSLYGGGGIGRFNSYYDGEVEIASEALMQSYYLQPGISLRFRKQQFYLGGRFPIYNFYSGKYETRTPLYVVQTLNDLVGGTPYFVPTGIFSYILKPKKVVSLSVNTHIAVNVPNILLPLEQRVFISLSAGVDLDEVFYNFKNSAKKPF